MKQSQIQVLISGVFTIAMLEAKQSDTHWSFFFVLSLMATGYMIASTISSHRERNQ